MKSIKKKLCKVCRKKYEVLQSHQQFQNWCSHDCAVTILINKQKNAAARKEYKRKNIAEKLNLIERSAALVAAQSSFNKYIRLRDYSSGCISCGKYYQENPHAGHYLRVGSHFELRFEPLNCHLQCMKCNITLSGNKKKYRERLSAKIGQKKLDWLEGPHKTLNISVNEIKAIAEKYKTLHDNILATKKCLEHEFDKALHDNLFDSME